MFQLISMPPTCPLWEICYSNKERKKYIIEHTFAHTNCLDFMVHPSYMRMTFINFGFFLFCSLTIGPKFRQFFFNFTYNSNYIQKLCKIIRNLTYTHTHTLKRRERKPKIKWNSINDSSSSLVVLPHKIINYREFMHWRGRNTNHTNISI